jgi:hypothetical protein
MSKLVRNEGKNVERKKRKGESRGVIKKLKNGGGGKDE